MDRFSLLLLEPGEIYFEDFKVIYHARPEDRQPQVHNEVPGRLKVCSKSVVFVPSSHLLPMLKFPLADCNAIDEWSPRSFQSALAAKQELLFISCKQTVEMLKHNVVAPFNFRRTTERFVFSFTYRKVADCLSQVQQLHRASSLPPVEQNGMIAAIVFSRQSRLQFDTCWIDNLQEKIIMETVGSKISPLVLNPGRIMLTSQRLYFQAYNNLEAEPVVKIRLSSIKRMFRRRYLLRPQGLEIEYESSKGSPAHIYLSLGKPGDRDKLVEAMLQQQELQIQSHEAENMTLKWQHGVLSNYDYLLYINSLADRSFNDLTQYPVFPWVVQDYTSPHLNLDSRNTYRDLSKPIGAINPERLESLKARREELPEPSYLYGSHYSTPGFVLYYLVRKVPEYMLCLQNGRFDHPDRMFNSIPQTWRNVTTNQSDFKELVPEFYQSGDFLVNSLGIEFGKRQDGSKVGDVQLPPWADSPKDFVSKLRTALESEHVSKSLHHWIDLIFGYKQRGQEAELADNVFYPLCYEGCVDLDEIADLNERYGLEVQISEFGQIPKQIFSKPHPVRYTSLPPSIVLHTDLSPSKSSSAKRGSWHPLSRLLRQSDYQSHKEPISAVCLYQDSLVASASQDSTVKLYTIKDMRLERSFSAKTMTISSLVHPAKSSSLLLGCWDSSIVPYQVTKARLGPAVPAHSDAVSCLAWSGGRLASGGWDGRVRVWRCGEEGLPQGDGTIELNMGSPVTCVSILSDKEEDSYWVAAGSREGEVVIWRLEGCRASLSQQIPAHSRQVNCVEFSPCGERIVSGGSDFQLKVFDLGTGTAVLRKNMGEEVTCLVWDGIRAVLGGGRGLLALWDLVEGREVWRDAAGHEGRVTALAASEQGRLVISGGEDRRVIVWRTDK